MTFVRFIFAHGANHLVTDDRPARHHDDHHWQHHRYRSRSHHRRHGPIGSARPARHPDLADERRRHHGAANVITNVELELTLDQWLEPVDAAGRGEDPDRASKECPMNAARMTLAAPSGPNGAPVPIEMAHRFRW
jgi:hypothetical protein